MEFPAQNPKKEGREVMRQSPSRVRIGIATLAATAALSARGSQATIKYRVIAEVDDNGVIHTGSSVWQFKISENIPLGGRSYKPSFAGEAVAVDIPGRGTLFIIARSRLPDGSLGSSDITMQAERLFESEATRSHKTRRPRHEVNRAIGRMVGKAKALHCPELFRSASRPEKLQTDCPFMVRFRDTKVPATVEAVDPANLDQSFGKGVRLKRIVIQITDQDGNYTINKRLPWIETYRENKWTLNGSVSGIVTAESSLASLLGGGAFSRGGE